VTVKPKKWKELPGDITAPHRTLVTAMREIRDRSTRTQAEIAKDAKQAPTTLSNHLNGGRIPEVALLQDFYAVIEKDAAGSTPLPHTLDALLNMRFRAQKKHCDCCDVGYPPIHDSADAPGAEQPASRGARNSLARRVRRPHHEARRREPSLPQERMRVPVPRAEGDRHPANAAELMWAETGVVARYLTDGRSRDADLLLWRAGTYYSADSLLEAVRSCRSAGLRAAAETILINVAERTDKQAVLNIAAAFSSAGRYEDVAFMLAAASGTSG
jgi:transcriptional regulator with XRE-family HTH domain